MIQTVAISRQRGSGGSYVGRSVAERLGYRFIDRDMLRVASEYLRTSDAAEKVQPVGSWWSRLGQTFAFGAPDSASYVPPQTDDTYEGELFDIEKKIISEIVEGQIAAEPTVIVGRATAQTLRGRSGVLTVFIHAPEAWRIEREQQVHELADRAAAQRSVHDSDRARARFVKALAGVDWTDMRNYDLTVDTAAIGFDAAADVIVRAAAARFERRTVGDHAR